MGRLTEEVLRRADIVEVVSSYLPLKKRGANWWALSPFKPEKTPSFAVSPSKQIFKCFSSGKGGNVIQFVMEMEGLSYGEALRRLAERYGISLPEERSERWSRSARERYLSLYREAVRFYREALGASAAAQAYLDKRAVAPQTAEAFLLGYAPASWDSLSKRLLGLGFQEEALIEAGLAGRATETGRLYDRFRDRLIFPIQDEQGEVIALAGRLLTDKPDEPKYLNSPETPFYKKGEVVYGFSQAKTAIRQSDRVLVVEGYMDALRLYQGGFQETVAISGTTLTQTHIQKLRRLTRRLYFLLDADEAGQAAVHRNMEPALAGGCFVYVGSLPSGKDPDEFLRQAGPEALLSVLEGAESWVRFLKRTLGGPQPETRYALYNRIGQLLIQVPDPFLRRAYAEEIQSEIGIEPSFWEGFSPHRMPQEEKPTAYLQALTADSELLRLWLSYPYYLYDNQPLWRVCKTALGAFRLARPELEALRMALMNLPWESQNLEGALLLEAIEEPLRDQAAALMLWSLRPSEAWRQWDEAPLEEDPALVFETNYRRLALDHLQKLLAENQAILAALSPEVAAYQEHIELHQALLEKRREIAERDGVILPYRLSSTLG